MNLAEIREGSILLFNKPIHWTSFDVVNKVKKLTGAKTGHAGTLDPLASGLLIVCTGKMTKQVAAIQQMPKEYLATVMLGATTPSFDLETEIDGTFDYSFVTDGMLQQAVQHFLMQTEQIIPSFSAKRLDGKRYYDLARKGIAIAPKKQSSQLLEFELIEVALPKIKIRIVCGKGFYVRSLAHELGSYLHTGSHLAELCRTRIGRYNLHDAMVPDDFANKIQASRPL
jgi:tRNA pseudouridine55 synthase